MSWMAQTLLQATQGSLLNSNIQRLKVLPMFLMGGGHEPRKGSLVGLLSFLDEAKERALQTYRSELKKRQSRLMKMLAEGIAIGATYFYMLSNSRQRFTFNWDIALSFVGDSGPYVQYALARFSVEDKAQAAGIRLPEGVMHHNCKSDCVHELDVNPRAIQETSTM